MSSTPLWENSRWQIVLPELQLTGSHLAIIDRDSGGSVDGAGAVDLIEAYRRSRAALWRVAGSRGFQLCFAVDWDADGDAIGEPDPIVGASRVIHVFGRSPDDPTSPVRVMAQPRQQRSYVSTDPDRATALRSALDIGAGALGEGIDVPGPSDRVCDGCWPDVLTSQERWRFDGVRVIRPRHVMIDPQVILMPLRHVVSFGDLTAGEVASLFGRLDEVRHQFGLASGSTGLSCFGNDGTAARQETPHVHLHVFGRSRDETTNPFELLGQRIQASREQEARS